MWRWRYWFEKTKSKTKSKKPLENPSRKQPGGGKKKRILLYPAGREYAKGIAKKKKRKSLEKNFAEVA